MFNFHKNHKSLVWTSWIVFAGLSALVAVLPAYRMQQTQPLPAMEDLSTRERNGLQLYVSENCMACHTQQVRNIEMDKVWGDRPSMASDYYYSKTRQDLWRQSPSLLGSERTGPDLTSVGQRQPGREWHLLHLYNPRIVVRESVMPGYPWLFREKDEDEVGSQEVVVPIPEGRLKKPGRKVVATPEALDLVAYLQSLRQSPLPEGTTASFIPSQKKKEMKTGTAAEDLPDGEKLYIQTCAACHQAEGTGLAGAFPPLAGSPVVTDENYETLIKIILSGYDARTEYGVMPGFAAQLSDEEVAAIANHERSSWGNQAGPVTAEEVGKIRAYMTQLNQ